MARIIPTALGLLAQAAAALSALALFTPPVVAQSNGPFVLLRVGDHAPDGQ